MSAETGLQIQTLPDEPQRVAWAADSKSIIYNLNNNLFQTTLDGSEKKQLTNYESGHLRWFAVSHDYRQIAMSRGNSSSEAVLIENFRSVINTSNH